MKDYKLPDNLVIPIIAENENKSLEIATAGYFLFFDKFGMRYKMLNLYNKDDVDHLLKCLTVNNNVVYAYGIAGVGSSLKLSSGKNLWTSTKKKFVSLWYDHPSYNYQQHCVDSPYILNIYHIKDHLDARQKFLPKSQSKSIYIPPPCEIDHRTRTMPFEKRNGRILYAKTAEHLSSWEEAWKVQPQDIQDILWALTDLALKDRNIDLSTEAARLFDNAKKDRSNLNIFMGVIQEVDGYVRAWRSDRLGRALLNHPADIIGRGWDYLEDKSNVAALHGAIPADTYVKKMQSYKIIANTSPLWRDGIHERVVSAINCGAIALTDRSEKSDYAFTGLDTYCGFDWDDDLGDVIADTLKKSDQSFEPSYDKIDSALVDKLQADKDRYFLQLMDAVENMPQ